MKCEHVRRWGILAATLVLLAACEPPAREALAQTPARAAIELEDALRKPVRYPEAPRRIVPLTSATAGYILALGGGGRLAGVAAAAHAVDTLYQLPQIQLTDSLDIAALRATEPDALVATAAAFTEELRLVGSELNAPVLFLPSERVEAAPAAIRMLGPVLGRPKAASSLADSIAAATAAVRARFYPDTTVQGPSVLILIGEDPVQGLTPRTFVGDAVAYLGGRNVLAGAPGRFPTLDIQALGQLQPDVIVVVSNDRDYPRRLLEANPVLRTTPALENGRFYIADPALVLQASIRTPDALDLIGQFLWPEKAAGGPK